MLSPGSGGATAGSEPAVEGHGDGEVVGGAHLEKLEVEVPLSQDPHQGNWGRGNLQLDRGADCLLNQCNGGQIEEGGGQCTMCTLYSFFSSRPSEVRLILKSPKCCTIQHKFVPARSVERNIEKIRFP